MNKEDKETGFIYIITNLINDKKYIGQTSRSVKRRFDEHVWRHGQVIDKAIDKYGKENFKYDILEECNIDILDEREEYWIAKYDTYEGEGYNIHKGGRTLGIGDEHPRTGQITPKEVKDKMRKTLKENGTWELRQGENHPYYGMKHTKEIRNKIRKGHHKNSQFNKKEAIKIIKKYYESNFSQNDIAKKYNCHKQTINRIINLKHWTTEDLKKTT